MNRSPVGTYSAKEGVPFQARIFVRLHPDELALLDLRRGEESRADYARAAIREKMARETAVRQRQPAQEGGDMSVGPDLTAPRERDLYDVLPVQLPQKDG